MPVSRPERAGAALRWGRAYLEACGVEPDEARASARLLLARALEVPGHTVVAEPERPVSAQAWSRYVQLILRRGRREPVAYLLGSTEFYGRSFRVTPATLIPRPETELLVDVALAQLGDESCVVADLGTGSGAIAVTLALERPRWTVLATDCSPAALKVARENAGRYGVTSRIRWYTGDWCEPLLAAGWGGRLAAVISNPPYVAATELPTLAEEIRRYEPHVALTPGLTGLEAYQRLVPGAARLLAPGGYLLLEVGHGQADDVTDLLRRHGFRDCRVWKDLASIPRVVGGGGEPGPAGAPSGGS
ncbi:MAG: peptide chain release factor N(5)-glutamine methyltransferase [Bacillota bacterium]|nr:MAG: peptide chain release factor N(5)-glutamine methyltransferase [Bacillota bacterium]